MIKLINLFLLVFFTCSTLFPQQFRVVYSSSVFSEPFTGNVFLFLSKYNKNPKDGEAGLEIFPCYSALVKNIKSGDTVFIDDKAISFPVKLSDLERGQYFVQAVWDMNHGGRSIAASPGNIYSNTIKTTFTKDKNEMFTINCDQIVPVQIFTETELGKELKISSGLLTNFYKKHVTIDAAILLPREYVTEPSQKFPVVFIVIGFGGNYREYSKIRSANVGLDDTTACIKVFLDGNCSWGHSVYANSDNNGPWGDALIEEFIPALERQYRCNGARLITGHSSGGWSSLWLQTHYPKVFAGCWSSAPDEVDFRSFCNTDIYSDRNMFYNKDSTLKLSSIVEGRFPWTYMKDVYQQENVILHGEQMHSYEAVFSKIGNDGFPERICDSNTGAIDSATVVHWKDYDISIYLRNNWGELKKDLDGKVRVSVGEQDNWFLNNAVHLLEKEMQKLNAKFEFAYYPGGHSTVFSTEYKSNGMQFLQQKYKEWLDITKGTNK
jgi:S-formylglutathione hydrolase FrmB